MIVDAHVALDVLRKQHKAIDLLITKLCVADATFRPTQSGELWATVEAGNALILSLELEVD